MGNRQRRVRFGDISKRYFVMSLKKTMDGMVSEWTGSGLAGLGVKRKDGGEVDSLHIVLLLLHLSFQAKGRVVKWSCEGVVVLSMLSCALVFFMTVGASVTTETF